MRKPKPINRPKSRAALSRRSLLVTGALVAGAAGGTLFLADATPTRAETVVATMSPSCGCCGAWVDYIRRAGFHVEVVETDNILAVKEAAGLPDALQSCHTAQIAGYYVEGHVPLSAIDKLLAERPAVDGIALGAMPPGSPGMGGEPRASYPVEAFKDGRTAGRFMDAPLR